MEKVIFVGLDVHKATIAITTADEGREGVVRFHGTIANTPTDVVKLTKRLSKGTASLMFCYEAGCCGYGIYRQLISLGHSCAVVAPH